MSIVCLSLPLSFRLKCWCNHQNWHRMHLIPPSPPKFSSFLWCLSQECNLVCHEEKVEESPSGLVSHCSRVCLEIESESVKKVFWCLSCVSFGSICSVQSCFPLFSKDRRDCMPCVCWHNTHKTLKALTSFFLLPIFRRFAVISSCEALFAFLNFGILWTCSTQYLPFEFALE